MTSVAPPPPAPAAIPADWAESTVQVPGSAVAATYTAPRSAPDRLRAALVLGDDDRGGQVATKQIAVMLAHQGVASLRYDGALAGNPDYAQALDRAGRALTALAETSKVDDARLLAVGHGPAAPLVIALGAGQAQRPPRPIALIEPVVANPLPNAPDIYQNTLAMTDAQTKYLDKRKHNLVTCSDADVAVDCSAVQGVVDMMTGTHVNFVRLRGVSYALQEDESRDPARYGAPDLSFSASLNRTVGTWVSMQ
ncbi:hypothetical protein GCM10009551_098860 [Nocardiopsis tropica]